MNPIILILTNAGTPHRRNAPRYTPYPIARHFCATFPPESYAAAGFAQSRAIDHLLTHEANYRWPSGMTLRKGREERRSFLKKRTKKLLFDKGFDAPGLALAVYRAAQLAFHHSFRGMTGP